MNIKSRFTLVVLAICTLSILTGCASIFYVGGGTPDPQLPVTPANTETASVTPFLAMTNTPFIIPPTYTETATFTPSATNTPLPTDTPIPTDTPVPTATPGEQYNPGGYVIAPILLYHHVADVGYITRYYVTPDVFRTQLEKLREWGYTSITVSQLVNVLLNGGNLPAHPVVITFDDGNNDIYDIAFPIMQEMGFVGTFYIVGNRLQSNYYVHPEEIQEMVNAGWEIGDHGMSHIDLTLDYTTAHYEIQESRVDLEAAIGTQINTFAYPYGKTDEVITNKVSEYGYLAGMGLGRSWEHSLGSLFYMSRIEVQGDYDLSTFAALLPWSGN